MSPVGQFAECVCVCVCVCAPSPAAVTASSTVQIIAMSATLPNLSLLARWLDAHLYHTHYRPVPLTEMIKIGPHIYDSAMTRLRTIDSAVTFRGDEDHILPLCLETTQHGHSVLIFCPTKNWCEKLADTIAREFYGICKLAASEAGSEKGEPGLAGCLSMVEAVSPVCDGG